MLSKFIKFVKTNEIDIILVIGVILISLFSFAMGYLSAEKEKEFPLIFEQIDYEHQENSDNRSRD